MKQILLIILTVMIMGCASAPAPPLGPAPDPIVNAYGDNAKQAELRNWVTREISRINEKRTRTNDALNAGQIGYEEYFLLMDECSKERASIPQRARARFLK